MKSKFADSLRILYTKGYFDHPIISNDFKINGLLDDCIYFNHEY